MSDGVSPYLWLAVGDVTDVAFLPPMGRWVTGIVVLAAFGASCWYYLWRVRTSVNAYARLTMLLTRLMAIACLAWYLAGPGRWVGGEAGSSSVPVRILLDTSASMAQRDIPAGPAVEGRAIRDHLSRGGATRAEAKPDNFDVNAPPQELETRPPGRQPENNGWVSRWRAVRRSWLALDFLDELNQAATDLGSIDLTNKSSPSVWTT